MDQVTRRDIVRGLRDLGLGEGDTVLTHSSLKSFGHVEGGPGTVLEAVTETVGPEGTTVYPVFPFLGYCSIALPAHPVVDLRTRPSRVGAITEEARHTAGFLQSIRPYHTVVARGPKADYLVKAHQHSLHTCGPGTPFEKLLDLNAFILLLGVDSQANTFLHCIEELAPAPYIYNGWIYQNITIGPDGKQWLVRTKGFTTSHPRKLSRIDPVMREKGLVAETGIGACRAMAMRTQELFEVVSGILRKDPYFLVEKGPGVPKA